MRIPKLWRLLPLLLLAACQTARSSVPPTATATMAAVSPVAPTASPTAVAEATATALPLPAVAPTATVLPTATATPLPPVTLALPEALASREGRLLAILAEMGARAQWGVSFVAAPDAAWAAGQVTMALVAGEAGAAGLPAGQQPLALTVPFTLPLEGVSQTGLEQILAGLDGRVTIQPWAGMSPTAKALRVTGLLPDDPAYPVQQPYYLLSDPAHLDLATELAALLPQLLSDEPLLHLAFTGDLMLDRALGYAISVQNNLDYPFAGVRDILAAADLTIGNLESALGDTGAPAPKRYTFQAPPAAAEAVARAGFDIVSLANNHGMDYGPESLLQGIGLLQAQGVVPIGAGADRAAAHAPYIVEQNGLRLAFLAYVNVPVEVSGFDTQLWDATPTTPGLAWGTPEVVAADVAAVRDQVDHVIVVLHSGYEYQANPSPPQQAISHAAIDAGAALVVGHHAHILQGIEYYGAGVIVYGLGNFAFEIDGDPRTAILNVWLDADGVRQLEIVPAVIQFGGPPRLATGAEIADIRGVVYALTRPLNPGRFP
ncbi:MAG: CapA family protein [Ardenticatenales bacterium]|nr:CapA family protein [Ardenticatenales bacterium]